MVGAVGETDAVEPFGGGGEGLFVGDAASQQGHGDVFERGELRQQVVELPDVTDVAVAVGGCLPGRQAGDVGVGAPNFAGGGAVERGEEVEQGTLAGTGFADDGDHFSGSHFERQIAKEIEADSIRAQRRIGFFEGYSSKDGG